MFKILKKERRSLCDIRRSVCLAEGADTAKDLTEMLVPHVQVQTEASGVKE